jgi:hypothetical protein
LPPNTVIEKYSFLVIEASNDHPLGKVNIFVVEITVSNVVAINDGNIGSTTACVTNRITDPSDTNIFINPLDVAAKALTKILSTLDPLGPATKISVMGPVPSNILLAVNKVSDWVFNDCIYTWFVFIILLSPMHNEFALPS